MLKDDSSLLPILPLTHTLEVGLFYLHTSRFRMKLFNMIPQWDIWKHLPMGHGLSDILNTVDFTSLVAYLLWELYGFLALIKQINQHDTGY